MTAEELPCWRVVVRSLSTRRELANEIVESPSYAKAAMLVMFDFGVTHELQEEGFSPMGGGELVTHEGDYRVSVQRSVLKPRAGH